MSNPYMTTQEFRDRIRKLCGVPEGTGRKANPCLVRKPTDHGYKPTPKSTKERITTMTKKNFIALADAIREHDAPSWLNKDALERAKTSLTPFTHEQLETLAQFCQSQNSNFNRTRWLDYIAGKCGPNGGTR